MTQSRQGIIDNIQSTLATIATSSNYLTDVANVSRTIKTWNELIEDSSQLPYLCVMPEQATVIYQQMYSLKMNLPIFIVAVQTATSESDKTEKLSNIITDIIEAMLYDQSRGGYAIATNVVDVVTDEGDPDATDSYGLSAVAVLHFNIVFEADTRHYTTPTFASASIDNATLIAIWNYTSNHIDTFNTASVPDTTDFTVTGSSSGAMTISDVTISGSNVIFTMASAVNTYETITLSYASGSNPLVSYNGELEAADLTNETVTNATDFIIDETLTTDDTGVYVYLPVNDTIDPSSVPDTTDFTLTGSLSGSITVSTVTIQSSPDRVRLTVPSVLHGETLTLSYVVGSNPIYNTDQSQSIVAFSSQAVTNNKDFELEHLIGRYYTDTDVSNGFILEYPVDLDIESTPATTDFTLTGSAIGSVTIQSVSVSGDRVTVEAYNQDGDSTAFPNPAETLTMSYTAGSNPIKASATGDNAPEIASQVIAKWEPGFDRLNNDGYDTRLYIQFFETLSESYTPAASVFTLTGSVSGTISINTVTIEGTNKKVRLDISAMSYGETATLNYTRPSSNTITSATYSGVEAADIVNETTIILSPP